MNKVVTLLTCNELLLLENQIESKVAFLYIGRFRGGTEGGAVHPVFLSVKIGIYCLRPGAHNLQRVTSMRSCYCVFTDQFIFRTILARILNIF